LRSLLLLILVIQVHHRRRFVPSFLLCLFYGTIPSDFPSSEGFPPMDSTEGVFFPQKPQFPPRFPFPNEHEDFVPSGKSYSGRAVSFQSYVSMASDRSFPESGVVLCRRSGLESFFFPLVFLVAFFMCFRFPSSSYPHSPPLYDLSVFFPPHGRLP